MKSLVSMGVWIVILLFQGWSAVGEGLTIVVAGVTTGTEATQVEEKVSEGIETLFPGGKERITIRADVADGVYLVKVIPAVGERERNRLLLALKGHYPDMVVLSGSERRFREPLPDRSPGPMIRMMDFLGIRWRWEWAALGILAFVGSLWLLFRYRRLGRLDSEQRRLDYRQSSIWARLREERDGE
ncbi:hypothetical protein [Nitratifractor sp.]